MSPPIDLFGAGLSLLGKKTPSTGDLFTLFGSLGQMPKHAQDILVKVLLDDEQRKRLAIWSSTFSEKLNEVKGKRPSEMQGVDPSLHTDFMAVMKGTSYVGDKIGFEELSQAQNLTAKLIKAENYADAISIGLTLGKFLLI